MNNGGEPPDAPIREWKTARLHLTDGPACGALYRSRLRMARFPLWLDSQEFKEMRKTPELLRLQLRVTASRVRL